MRKITPEDRRAERQPVQRRSARAAPAKIRAIMQEARERPYKELICGHYTHKEAIERDSAWQPSKDVFWCSKCEFWTQAKPKAKAADQPWDPPF
jgi:hypothetical protein